MKKILKVEQIQKYYGNKENITKAIDGISFDVEEGEFIGIMGASGSGKTTLLNCISTIDNVSSGHIYLDGKDITEIKEENKLKRIGYMQGLGEWILYLDYKDGTKDEIVLKDHEAHDLYMYIKQNGSIAGTKGKVAKYTLILSISVIIIDKVLLIINKNRKKY